MRSALYVALISCTLLSCASLQGAKFQAIQTEASKAVVYIYSAETGCLDLGQMNATVLIDQQERFVLSENSFARVVLEPGTYTFESSTDDQKACHGQWSPGKVWPPVTLQLEAKTVHFLQYNEASKSCVTTCSRHLKEVARPLALKDMKGTLQILAPEGDE